jgi:hypothetical protein
MIDFRTYNGVKHKQRLMHRTPGAKKELTVMEEGYDLLRPAKPEDVVPGNWDYYNKTGFNPTDYVRTIFYPSSSWQDIVDLCNHGHIFVRINFKPTR